MLCARGVGLELNQLQALPGVESVELDEIQAVGAGTVLRTGLGRS